MNLSHARFWLPLVALCSSALGAVSYGAEKGPYDCNLFYTLGLDEELKIVESIPYGFQNNGLQRNEIPGSTRVINFEVAPLVHEDTGAVSYSLSMELLDSTREKGDVILATTNSVFPAPLPSKVDFGVSYGTQEHFSVQCKLAK